MILLLVIFIFSMLGQLILFSIKENGKDDS